MSSPDHPISNLEDVFSSNFPNYVPPASPDYVLTSPGKTYSTFYTEKSPIPSPIIIPPKTQEFFLPEGLLSPMQLSPSTPSQPQALEIGETSRKSAIKRHEEQIQGIQGYLEENPSLNVVNRLKNRHRRNTGPTGTPAVKTGNYKEFISCQPFYFNGTEGAVGLIRWFERTKSVFSRSRCAKENKVTFATGTLTDDALSWKMEEELYNLIVKGNDLKPYVRRFQELTVLCPNMVPNNDKLLEAFIGGLPRSIEGNVTASKPQTLEEAINIAQRLMDQVTKHAPMQVSSDNKRKFDDRRTFNNKIPRRQLSQHQNVTTIVDTESCNYNHTNPVHGHYTNQCQKTNINAQGRAYMLKDKNAQQDPNVVTVMEKKVDEKRLEDIPVVKEFKDVFPEDLPGIPPIPSRIPKSTDPGRFQPPIR
ncbi:hypothetical protein Tco_0475045 [Tanacetum coccineum]